MRSSSSIDTCASATRRELLPDRQKRGSRYENFRLMLAIDGPASRADSDCK